MSLSPSICPQSLSCWCCHVSFLRTVTLALLSKILKLLQFKKPTYLFISAGCSECFVATIFLFTSDYSAAVIFVPVFLQASHLNLQQCHTVRCCSALAAQSIKGEKQATFYSRTQPFEHDPRCTCHHKHIGLRCESRLGQGLSATGRLICLQKATDLPSHQIYTVQMFILIYFQAQCFAKNIKYYQTKPIII